MRLAFCWAHMRRPFYEFHASTKSPLAAEVLARIAKLYAIEAEIRGQPRRAPTGRSSATKSTDRRGPACLAAGPRAARVRLRPIWRRPCAMRCGTGPG